MELKQAWMSWDTQKQSRYSLRTLGGILGIAMLALALVLGGTALGFMLGWPMRLVSVGLWLGVTVLLVALALRLGQNTVRDATLYFLTRDDRLFVADVRQLAGMGHSALDWAKGTVRVQQRLRRWPVPRFCPPPLRRSCGWNRSGRTAPVMRSPVSCAASIRR